MDKAKSLRPIPEPPLLVLAKAKRRRNLYWYSTIGGRRDCLSRVGWHDWAHAKNLTVIEHPRNDPEAVKIITEAKTK